MTQKKNSQAIEISYLGLPASFAFQNWSFLIIPYWVHLAWGTNVCKVVKIKRAVYAIPSIHHATQNNPVERLQCRTLVFFWYLRYRLRHRRMFRLKVRTKLGNFSGGKTLQNLESIKSFTIQTNRGWTACDYLELGFFDSGSKLHPFDQSLFLKEMFVCCNMCGIYMPGETEAMHLFVFRNAKC